MAPWGKLHPQDEPSLTLLGRRSIRDRRRDVDTPEACRRTVVRMPGGRGARTDAMLELKRSW